MSDAPYSISLHIGDYLRDTEELSMLQHGAYLRLMMWYYSTAKPIPNDLDRIYRRCGATSREEKAAIEFVLGEFFVLKDGKWTQKRIEFEILEWAERTKVARENALKKWEKFRKNKEIADAEAVQRHSKGIANPDASLCLLPLPLPLPDNPPSFLPSTQQQPIVGDAAKKRGSRLKIETLPEDWKAWAEQKRPDLDPHAVFEGFSDYWASAPGQKGIKLDWAATWRNWIRNQAKQAKAEPHQNWWQSESGLLGKGRELGMQPWGGESWAQFKDRLFVACKQKA